MNPNKKVLLLGAVIFDCVVIAYYLGSLRLPAFWMKVTLGVGFAVSVGALVPFIVRKIDKL